MYNVENSKFIVFNGKLVDCSRPRVMAIINSTPDSFYAGSRNESVESLRRSVEKAMTEGADMLDVGGYSSRPGACEVPVEEEIHRVATALEVIRADWGDVPVSVDTFRGEVARVAVTECGASMINDISAFSLDDDMLKAIVDLEVPYILMHMRGTPQTMQSMTEYDDFIPDVLRFFAEKIDTLRQAGFSKEVILDPGFGFAKTVKQNYELLDKMGLLGEWGAPVLVGVSRKSMIYRLLGTTPEESLNGTSVINAFALERGANILRVHDVKEAVETVKIFLKMRGE